MKKEVCLMCIVCFFLGYFVADVVSKCGFGREHLTGGEIDSYADLAEHLRVGEPGTPYHPPKPGSPHAAAAGCTAGDPGCKASKPGPVPQAKSRPQSQMCAGCDHDDHWCHTAHCN